MTALTLFKYVLAVALGWALAPFLVLALLAAVVFGVALLVAAVQIRNERRRYNRRK